MIKIGTFYFILVILLVSMISGSIGFLFAGVASTGKIEDLYAWLDVAEQNAHAQSLLTDSLMRALSTLLASIDAENATPLNAEAIKQAKAILAVRA